MTNLKCEPRLPPKRLTKRDLIIGLSLGGNYIVTVHQTNEGLFTISVLFEGKNTSHSIETARGNLKVWRNVQSAILFVQENCKSATNVIVEIGTWKLSRTN